MMVKNLLIISLVWCIFIFILCSIPGSSLPKSPTIPHFDKVVHAGLYFMFVSFILPVLDLSGQKLLSRFSSIIAILIAGIYGGFIEIAQENWFINRSADIVDLYSDIAGAIMAVGFYYLITKKLIKKIKKV